MALFRRRTPAQPGYEGVGADTNMLPPDNVYLPTALGANEEYARLGWNAEVVAVRMPAPGQLFVAIVTDDTDGRLPGPNPVFEVVELRLRPFGHKTLPDFFDAVSWAAAASSARWRYRP